MLRTVDPHALTQPCGRDSWPILVGLEATLDETCIYAIVPHFEDMKLLPQVSDSFF